MKKFVLFAVLAASIASCSVLPDLEFEITGTKYDIGSPSAAETYLLELINRARSDPAKEAWFLTHTGDASINSSVQYFATQNGSTFAQATNAIVQAFAGYTAAAPLAFNAHLVAAAHLTTDMEIQYDTQDHNVGGTSPWDRMETSGYTGYASAGENIYCYSEGMLYGHAGFNIDWGAGPNGLQDPPGHRLNIMGVDRYYREIGISAETNVPSGKNVGPVVIAEEFGEMPDTVCFITGVVYDDRNGNRFYDMGEGIGDVVVSLEGHDYYAVTSGSGAYTVPFTAGKGSVRVQAGSGEFATQVVTVTLGSENYKLDFNLQGTAANGDASVGFPAATSLPDVTPALPSSVYRSPIARITRD